MKRIEKRKENEIEVSQKTRLKARGIGLSNASNAGILSKY
jgi:hypothetical protein